MKKLIYYSPDIRDMTLCRICSVCYFNKAHLGMLGWDQQGKMTLEPCHVVYPFGFLVEAEIVRYSHIQEAKN